MGTLFTVLMVLGAAFAAIVLAVAGDWMLAELAVAFGTIAFTLAIDHGADSCVGSLQCRRD
jgi:hypothetical protein